VVFGGRERGNSGSAFAEKKEKRGKNQPSPESAKHAKSEEE